MFIIVSKYLVPRGYAGLTLFPFIFFKNKYYSQNKVTMNHEKIHIRQQIELLVLPFYVLYFLNLILNYFIYRDLFTAYCNIVFEREAYANEKNLDFLKSRSFWNFRKYFSS